MSYVSPEKQREYRQKRGEEGRRKQREYNLRRRLRVKEAIRAAKAHPCADCGRTFPTRAMDLHHPNGDKARNVSSCSTPNQVKAEAAKCIVLCAVCHRLRH